MVDFMSGTTIVVLNTVKMRLSSKDLLLLIGILVAAIIAFTTFLYRGQTGDNKQSVQKTSMNPSASVIVKKLIRGTI